MKVVPTDPMLGAIYGQPLAMGMISSDPIVMNAAILRRCLSKQIPVCIYPSGKQALLFRKNVIPPHAKILYSSQYDLKNAIYSPGGSPTASHQVSELAVCPVLSQELCQWCM